MPEPFFARTPQDLATREQMLSMSGLEFLLGIIAGEIAGPPIARLMGIRLVHAEHGLARFDGKPAFDHFNPMGSVHGGWYGTILDSALGCAVMSGIPRGSGYTTLEYKVNITRAVPLDTAVICEARLQHGGRSTSVAHAELRGADDNRLYATGSTTCIVLTP